MSSFRDIFSDSIFALCKELLRGSKSGAPEAAEPDKRRSNRWNYCILRRELKQARAPYGHPAELAGFHAPLDCHCLVAVYSDAGDAELETRRRAAREASFLLCTTSIGATWIALEQAALCAALRVYVDDPFPDKEAVWSALIDGSLASFLAPRGLYHLSYFLSDEAKRWDARISLSRERGAAARTMRERGAALWQLIDECARLASRESGALWRHAAWRCLAGWQGEIEAIEEVFARVGEVREAIAAGRVEAPPFPVRREGIEGIETWLHEADGALDAATGLGTWQPRAPAWPEGEMVMAAVKGKLERSREEMGSRGRGVLAARLAGGDGFAALSPIAEIVGPEIRGGIDAVGLAELGRYGWARRLFRDDGAILAALIEACRVSGRAAPGDPRRVGDRVG